MLRQRSDGELVTVKEGDTSLEQSSSTRNPSDA